MGIHIHRYISDAWLGRFRTMVAGFLLYILGYILLTLMAVDKLPRAICGPGTSFTDSSGKSWEWWLCWLLFDCVYCIWVVFYDQHTYCGLAAIFGSGCRYHMVYTDSVCGSKWLSNFMHSTYLVLL